MVAGLATLGIFPADNTNRIIRGSLMAIRPIDEIVRNSGVAESDEAKLRDALHQLDTNGDEKLETLEVATANGYLACNSVTKRWSFNTFNPVQNALFKSGLVKDLRRSVCPSTSSAERDTLWDGDYNCYAYAVSGSQRLPRKSLPHIPGVVGGQSAKRYTPMEVRDALIRDGLVPADATSTSKIPPARNGYYLIFAVVDYGRGNDNPGDYHFYRQDSDGFWSHKSGPHPISRIDASGNPITNPLYVNRDYRSVLFDGLRFDRSYNIPVGFFYVPDSGIDMAPTQ